MQDSSLEDGFQNFSMKEEPLLYRTLPENTIRLLEVLPGDFPDPIRTKLSEASIHETGKYEAVSYAWEVEKAEYDHINCNGFYMVVTRNLFNALKRFRRLESSRRLWVDALCINQYDPVERSQQVRLMTQIYRKSRDALIWVGEEKSNFDVKLAFRVADNRLVYLGCTRMIDRPKGTKPMVLISNNSEAVQLLLATQDQMQCDEIQSRLDILAALDIKDSRPKLFMGYKEWPSYDSELTDPFMVDINLNLTQVVAAKTQHFTNFDDFLKEAIKPPEWTLSIEDTATIYYTVLDLFNRSYFRRKWILQEVILSRTASIACGDHIVGFYSFCDVYAYTTDETYGAKHFMSEDIQGSAFEMFKSLPASHLRNLRGSAEHGYDGWGVITLLLEDQKRVGDGRARSRTLGWLLQRYDHQQASDLRDHVFSLVGIIQEVSEVKDELEFCKTLVDYSLGYAALCLKVATHLATAYKSTVGMFTNHTHILGQFTRETNKTHKWRLPSWVPDWSLPLGEDSHFNPNRNYDLGKLIPYHATVDRRALLIHGILIDTVSYTSLQLYDDWSTKGAAKLLARLDGDKAKNPYGTREKQFEAYWRTLICDNLPNESSNDPKREDGVVDADAMAKWISQCRDGYFAFKKNLPPPSKSSSSESSSSSGKSSSSGGSWDTISTSSQQGDELDESDHSVDDQLPAEEHNSRGADAEDTSPFRADPDVEWNFPKRRGAGSDHCLIRTEKGYLGLASPTVNRGDRVAIIAGSNVIWFLERQREHHYITGAGWIHGFMYKTDAFQAAGLKPKDIVEIEIR